MLAAKRRGVSGSSALGHIDRYLVNLRLRPRRTINKIVRQRINPPKYPVSQGVISNLKYGLYLYCPFDFHRLSKTHHIALATAIQTLSFHPSRGQTQDRVSLQYTYGTDPSLGQIATTLSSKGVCTVGHTILVTTAYRGRSAFVPHACTSHSLTRAVPSGQSPIALGVY